MLSVGVECEVDVVCWCEDSGVCEVDVVCWCEDSVRWDVVCWCEDSGV